MKFTGFFFYMKKMLEKYKKFEEWFDYYFGWFFTNGNKIERRDKILREKFGDKLKRND